MSKIPHLQDGDLVWVGECQYRVKVSTYKQKGRRTRISAHLKRLGFSTEELKRRLNGNDGGTE